MNTSSQEVQKEIRFAVVLYGGISLAIYINGVAQELFKMVRATSSGAVRENLSASEQVYHDIGKQLGVRFIVDILSGTSAGGINAVYLAKALANDQKMDGVEKVWLEEGDIARLVNDGASTGDLPASLQKILNAKPRKSLLNGQRMYYKLLEALHGMDQKPAQAPSPYASELDLFITATDLRGTTLPIRLSNTVIQENRYRSVFHFRYSARGEFMERNDFSRNDNPYLAFAARCTSSLPFAFEPVKFEDALEVIKNCEIPDYKDDSNYEERWKNYFDEFYTSGVSRANFEKITFGDGGYLDNKPFSYATRTIVQREAEFPIDRKLIYVEPAPEYVGDQKHREPLPPPDAIENTVAALLTLPRSETIREDIQFIKERNQIIERARNYQGFAIEGLTEDAVKGKMATKNRLKNWISTGAKTWPDMYLDESVKKYGNSYFGYHYARVAMVTDEIAKLITNSLGFDEDSDQFAAIRLLVQKWRNRKFSLAPEKGKETENQFMFRMDSGYRVRRLKFVLQIIDRLLSINEGNIDNAKDGVVKKARSILLYSGGRFPSRNQLPEYQAELRKFRKQFTGLLNTLIQSTSDPARLGIMDTAKLSSDDLKQVLEESVANPTANPGNKTMDGLLNRLSNDLYSARERSHKECRNVFASQVNGKNIPKMLMACLKFYFDSYDYFDTITLPLLAGTKAGESDIIDIIRISPEDATSQINDGIDKSKKLLGTTLGNFGAFFKREWRQNDILWGQLDAADIILKSLKGYVSQDHQKSEDQLNKWVEKAQAAILREKFLMADETYAGKSSAALKRANDAALKVLADHPNLAGGTDGLNLLVEENIKTLLENSLKDAQVLKLFVKRKLDRRFPIEPTTASASRAATVTGQVLDDLSTKYRILKKPAFWLARVGRFAWGFVEIVTPGNFMNILARHWFKLLYVAEAILILAGIIFSKGEVTTIGLWSLGATALIHLIVALAAEFLLTNRNGK